MKNGIKKGWTVLAAGIAGGTVDFSAAETDMRLQATHDTMAVPGFSVYSAATKNDDGLLVILQ